MRAITSASAIIPAGVTSRFQKPDQAPAEHRVGGGGHEHRRHGPALAGAGQPGAAPPGGVGARPVQLHAEWYQGSTSRAQPAS
jgi:hypothetical protein